MLEKFDETKQPSNDVDFRTTFLINHKMLTVKFRRDGNLAIINCGLIIRCY